MSLLNSDYSAYIILEKCTVQNFSKFEALCKFAIYELYHCHILKHCYIPLLEEEKYLYINSFSDRTKLLRLEKHVQTK